MGQIILHAAESCVEEDRDYYFSGERDKHNQVRPDQSVYSTTPFSTHLDYRIGDGQIGNFFFPAWANSLDRIYIGISVPLFANTWGASFLLELLKVLKPSGSIVLPVYPEGQAAEKGYWSRSFLENIFLSRSRWRGMSNIYAENDGVMSMRVGRKWPDPMPSSAEWFFRERSNLMLHTLLADQANDNPMNALRDQFIALCHLVWSGYQRSAIVEGIIKDTLGGKGRPTLMHVGDDYGLLANDLLLSDYISLDKARTVQAAAANELIQASINNYFSGHTADRHAIECLHKSQTDIAGEADVAVVTDLYARVGAEHYKALMEGLWARIPSGGVLVINETFADNDVDDIRGFEELHATLPEPAIYSALVASRRVPGQVISHYSMAVEGLLAKELETHAQVFRVYRKP